MMEYDLTGFEEDLKELGITLEIDQKNKFIKYYQLMIHWNSFMNLTAITDFDEVIKKHFVDSLSLIKYGLDLTNNISVIDIGTGAGFPGIPLKIAFPNLKLILLDSLNKRINFLNEVIDNLELYNISGIHGRAEDLARLDEHREQYDLCVSRAVANLSTLSEYCLPFVKKEGYFISYKSEKITEEMESAQNAIYVLGGKIIKQVDFYLPSSEIYRNLFGIQKIKETPKKYPRKAGLPAKEPL